GITAIELLPIAQFPGGRNWGYDGTYVAAAQNTYGGPLALKRLIDACHGRGLALVLDVVYNHLGPEGNYLAEFAPYFTDRYKTPREQLGRGFDTQWSDDFHHALHALLTREQSGYYAGFGKVSDLARVLTGGYLFVGQHSPYRGRKYGRRPATRNGAQFIVCAQ